jgi:hypothetical protein
MKFVDWKVFYGFILPGASIDSGSNTAFVYARPDKGIFDETIKIRRENQGSFFMSEARKK